MAPSNVLAGKKKRNGKLNGNILSTLPKNLKE
jgi:hypothetical protein